jgi:hypothetical protein
MFRHDKDRRLTAHDAWLGHGAMSGGDMDFWCRRQTPDLGWIRRRRVRAAANQESLNNTP